MIDAVLLSSSATAASQHADDASILVKTAFMVCQGKWANRHETGSGLQRYQVYLDHKDISVNSKAMDVTRRAVAVVAIVSRAVEISF